MPGLYRSPGLADIDVCAGKRQAGSEALNRTRQRFRDEDAQYAELMGRPRRSVTLPLPGSREERDEMRLEQGQEVEGARRGDEEVQDAEMSEGSMHEGFGERRAEETGLPPTPPEAASNVQVSTSILQVFYWQEALVRLHGIEPSNPHLLWRS